MRIHRLLSLGLLCALAVSVQADERDVYRWTDSEGNVHYSDRPMTDKAARLDITSKATDNARIAEQRQARAVNSQAKPVDAAEQTQSAPEDPDKAAARYAENCKRAQAALQSIVNARRLYVPTDDGSRRYLDKDETSQRRAKAQADVAEWCR
jgi:Spy/CpxP family protein refolding chaperone